MMAISDRSVARSSYGTVQNHQQISNSGRGPYLRS